MLRIIESYGSLPEQLPKNNKSDYHPGKFGMLTKDGVVASDGFSICGIIDDVKYSDLSCNIITRFKRSDFIIDGNKIYLNIKGLGKVFGVYIFSEEYRDLCLNISNVEKYNDLIFNQIGTHISIGALDEDYVSIFGKNLFIQVYSKRITRSKIINNTVIDDWITVWPKRMIAQTDQFEFEKMPTLKRYQLLYIRNGLLTNEKWTSNLKPAALFLEHDESTITFLSFGTKE